MKNLLIQIGIFLLLLIGIGFVSRQLGKYGLYFLLALTLIALSFLVLNTNDFTNRPFLFILLFGVVCILVIVKSIIKKN